MVPDFALSLSSEGLTLLRRQAGGWRPLAEAPFSAGAFDGLRNRALEADPAGTEVAIFLPNDQVRYIELPDPGDSQSVRRAALEAALDGATPYPVADLVLDWSLSGTTLLGAAVARETMNEAEAFLRERGFEPVMFAAIPPSGTFRGAAYFGPASGWTGAAPERPAKVILLAPEAEPEAQPEHRAEETSAAAVAAAAPAASATASESAESTDTPEVPSAPAEPEPVAEPSKAPEEQTAVQSDPAPAPPLPEFPEPAPEPQHPARPAMSAPTAPPAAPSFSSVRASRDAVPPAPEAAPRLTMGRTHVAAPKGKDLRAAAPAPEPEAKPDAPEAGAKRRGFGFGKRREAASGANGASAPQAASRPSFAPIKTPPEPQTGSETTQGIKQVTPRPPVSEPVDPSGVTPVSGRARVAALQRESGQGAQDQSATARRAASSLSPEQERDRMTVFGARSGQKVGGKPRFLGLVLTLLLLLFLLGVAAWASVFMKDEIAQFFAPGEPPAAPLTAPASTETDVAEVAPALATEEEAGDAELAALELPPAASEGLEDSPPLEPGMTPRTRMSADDAAARYAVDGIWQRAPNAPNRPPLTDAEDVYVASIDPEVQQFDAVALPDLDGTPREDLSLQPVRLPPAPGVRFDLDDRGLVKATPEGTVSPDGVRIFTGLPPQTPPLRDPDPASAPEVQATPEAAPQSETAPDAAETAEADETAAPETETAETQEEVLTTAALATDADPALQQFRPQGRPRDLIEQTERAVLGGVSLAELEQMRPQMRPLTPQEEAAALDLPTTEQAIGASLTPLPRPRTMETIVEDARQQAAQIPSGPSVPQSAGVAGNATQRHQIDLRDVALIGIYGKDSDRRALVRLPSGKYQKVQVGDRIDGGRIAAIDDDELRYVKSGRNVVLKMPRS
ncbi:hypothetical protein [Salipiger sp. PrR002]|uniref:hypothetical protein n=1 Tax=Salipiger sp. PrR002 TaxID=2706489 RepID=UPI0013BBBD77|nr:hypothetical protein [Salipiger sp. PrR002]NDV98926.1 hypothetical protein [Salipiger sp. PrR002]NDW55663.1 hypothetical protein [Salipiger sp. PrR004]